MNVYEMIQNQIKAINEGKGSDELENSKRAYAASELSKLYHNLKFQEELEKFKKEVKKDTRD